MTRDIIKLAIHSYIISSFIYRIEKYVKDKWECRKSAAVRCCLSLSVDTNLFRNQKFCIHKFRRHRCMRRTLLNEFGNNGYRFKIMLIDGHL